MIITQYGKDAIAAASAGQTKISFTNLKTSDTGTLTTDTYPDFQSIKQSISPSSITMDSQTDTAKVAGLFNNNNLGMAYQIKAVGLYATCAGAFAMATPRLFAYEIFGTPDFMPSPSEVPTSYTYAFNTTISDAATVEVVIQPGDYALASDLQELQGRLGFKTVTGNTSEEIISYIEALPIGVHFLIIPSTVSGNLNIRPVDYLCIYTYAKYNNGDRRSLLMKGWSSTLTNNLTYTADIGNNEIRIERIDNNITRFPSAAVTSLSVLTNYIDENIQSYEIFEITNGQASALGLGNLGYMLEIFKTNFNNTLLRATSLTNPVQVRYLRKVSAGWDSNWFEG